MTLEEAIKKAKDLGHKELEDDPPLASSMRRLSCMKCGRAVISYSGHVYGSAATDACER